MEKQIYEQISSTKHNTWACWDNSFDENINEHFSLEKHGNDLKPDIIFLGLNATRELKYPNFHYPNHANDRKLKNAIQGDSLEKPQLPSLFGAFMTDLVHDQAEADSSKVEIKDHHYKKFEKKLYTLGQDQYQIICFGGKVYDAMKAWLVDEQEYESGLKSCAAQSDKPWDVTIYKVMHYAFRFGKNVFPEQLQEIDKRLM